MCQQFLVAMDGASPLMMDVVTKTVKFILFRNVFIGFGYDTGDPQAVRVAGVPRLGSPFEGFPTIRGRGRVRGGFSSEAAERREDRCRKAWVSSFDVEDQRGRIG